MTLCLDPSKTKKLVERVQSAESAREGRYSSNRQRSVAEMSARKAREFTVLTRELKTGACHAGLRNYTYLFYKAGTFGVFTR